MKETPTPRSVEAAGHVLAAGIGLALGGPAGGLVAAAIDAHVVELTARTWGELAKTKLHNSSWVLGKAADDLDITPEQLVDQACRAEDTRQLLNDTVTATAQTFNEAKIRALATALANGLRDDAAHVDEELLVVRALTDLEALHIKQLARIVAYEDKDGSEPEHRDTRDDHPAVSAVLQRHGLLYLDDRDRDRQLQEKMEKERQSAERTAGLGVSMPAHIRRRTQPVRFRTVWRSTRFGRQCLSYLQQGAGESADS